MLEDLVTWVLHSGTGPTDPVFSRWTQFPGKPRSMKLCTGAMVTNVLKEFVEKAGLDPSEFAFHSLRSGSVTQMNAHGLGWEEANARGNYAKKSIMVQTVYNSNDTGRGPLASSNSGIGRRVGAKNIQRQMGVAYEVEK